MPHFDVRARYYNHVVLSIDVCQRVARRVGMGEKRRVRVLDGREEVEASREKTPPNRMPI